MPNERIEGHPLVGTTHVYRADHTPWNEIEDDGEPGVLVVGNGMTVKILEVFKNWNDIAGLDMLYVLCSETGERTHVTPTDLGLPALN